MLRQNAPLAKAFAGTLLATLLSLLINVASSDVMALKRWSNWAIWLLILLLVVLSLLLEGQRHRRSTQPDEASAPALDWVPNLEGSYRKRMIVRVRSSWMTDVFGGSLGAAARAAASARHPAALDGPLTPWNLVHVQRGMAEAIPADTPVVEVFDRKVGGAMLILGGPGAGKTTLLFRLASDLLDAAEVDPASAVPVVFKLASWSPPRSLDDWLVDELHKLYDVPSNLGRHWVATEQVMPLLDGLDEVPFQDRARCVEAVNAYRDRHGMTSLAVTSQSAVSARGRGTIPGVAGSGVATLSAGDLPAGVDPTTVAADASGTFRRHLGRDARLCLGRHHHRGRCRPRHLRHA